MSQVAIAIVRDLRSNLIKRISTYHCPTAAINNYVDVPNLKILVSENLIPACNTYSNGTDLQIAFHSVQIC